MPTPDGVCPGGGASWESHVVVFVFVLRGPGLLGAAGRHRCHLCLLGSLLHLQPLLLGGFRLLLPGLRPTGKPEQVKGQTSQSTERFSLVHECASSD